MIRSRLQRNAMPWPHTVFAALVLSSAYASGTLCQEYRPYVRYLAIAHDPWEQVDRAAVGALLSGQSRSSRVADSGLKLVITRLNVATLPEAVRPAAQLIESGEFETAHRLLQRYLRREREPESEALYLDALALMGMGGPGARNTAEERIREAVQRSPTELRYRLAMARILSVRTYSTYAHQELDRVLADFPNQAEALALKGRLLVETYWGLGWQAGGWGIDTSLDIPRKDAIRTDGLQFLNQALIVDPRSQIASWYLGLDSILSRDWAYVAAVMQFLVETTGNTAAYLGRGLALQHLGYPLQAWEDYQAGIERMSAQDQALAYSMGWIRSPSAGGFGATTPLESGPTSGTAAEDEQQWRRKDPILSTALNERLLEQLRRFAYVYLRYRDVDRDLAGWDTPMGRVYLRYGRPSVEASARGGIRGFMEGALYTAVIGGDVPNTVGIPLPETTRWAYPDFMVTFGGGYITGRQTFWPADQGDSLSLHMVDSVTDYDRIADALPELPNSIGVATAEATEACWYQFESPKGEYEYVPAIRVPLEVFTLDELQSGGGSLPVSIFLLDDAWQDIQTRRLSIPAASHRSVPYDEHDVLVYLPTMTSDAPASFAAIEIVPSQMDPVYTSRDSLQVVHTPGVRLSSIVPVEALTDEREGIPWLPSTYFSRGNLLLKPIASGEIEAGSVLTLYFEAYGLTLDEVGATDFEVSLTVSEFQESERGRDFLEAVRDLLGGIAAEGEVTLSWRRSGIESRVIEQLPLAMPETEDPMALHLTVRVRDLVSQQSAQRRLAIQVIPRRQ